MMAGASPAIVRTTIMPTAMQSGRINRAGIRVCRLTNDAHCGVRSMKQGATFTRRADRQS